MSDEPKIPSWQRVSDDDPITPISEPEHQPEHPEQSQQNASAVAEAPTPTESDLEEPESVSLLEQAKRFLDDPTIRDAPRQKKVAFLDSKGVSAEDIGTLLGEETHGEGYAELEDAGERAWSTVSAPCPCPVASLL
jgi:hypothetical protein